MAETSAVAFGSGKRMPFLSQPLASAPMTTGLMDDAFPISPLPPRGGRAFAGQIARNSKRVRIDAARGATGKNV